MKERIALSFNPRFHHVEPPSHPEVRAPNFDDHPRVYKKLDVTAYASGPDQNNSQFLHGLIGGVKKSTTSIHIGHMYFHPPEELLQALIDASNRGVQINIITNRDGEDMPYTHKLFSDLSRSNWKRLFEGKVKPNVNVFEFKVLNVTYHKKIFLIDEKIIFAGSSNCGTKSFDCHDQEMDIEIVSTEMGREVSRALMVDAQSLCDKVPSETAPNQKINEAAIAELQCVLANRWL